MMDAQSLLISGITSVTAALGFAVRVLFVRAEKCEQDRETLNARVASLERAAGLSEGKLDALDSCPAPACPFRPRDVVAVGLVMGVATLLLQL